MKIIAYYLPQFHDIPENDEWWGKGFTEWTNVKAAEPIYPGHSQPKIPLHNNYYNLLDDNTKLWQAKLAKEYGIYGFCYYHYWFNGKLLLEKPMEQMLANKAIDTKFCICWANEPWAKAWVGQDKKILIPQKYGDEKEWEEHYLYLKHFFEDDRYIKIDGKPLIIIYRPLVIACISEMVGYWNERAIKDGFPGISAMCSLNDTNIEDDKYDCFDNIIEWQPHVAKLFDANREKKDKNKVWDILRIIRRKTHDRMESFLGVDLYKYDPIAIKKKKDKRMMDYDTIWNRIINMKPLCPKCLPGAFVRWDNTPRYRERATIIKGETPSKFKEYMSKQIKHARDTYNSDFLFMYAWNEWAEGGYLEPDEEYGYEYLEALKLALEESGEFEN